MAGINKITFNRDAVMQSLEENGYAVIPNVLRHQECDECIKEYKDWMKELEQSGKSFSSVQSLIQGYRIGHFNASWNVRLKVKDVFAQIWETEKLLSSVDAVALSPPPEEGSNLFSNPAKNWLHLDQGAQREGLHAFQGGVYLEESSEEDYCFRVIARSHKEHSKFSKDFPNFISRSKDFEFYKLNSIEIKWYEDRGCKLVKVPVPKGGMVLWDSRTVHDNSKPEFGRKHKDRWRHVVFVCMTPATWATSGNIAKKQNAYNNMLMTTHWPSTGVSTFRAAVDEAALTPVKELPEIAKSSEARLLMGADSYDFEDGESNGPPAPTYTL